LKKAELDILTLDDESFPGWKDGTYSFNASYDCKKTEMGYDTPFIALLERDDGVKPGLGTLGATKVWLDEEQ